MEVSFSLRPKSAPGAEEARAPASRAQRWKGCAGTEGFRRRRPWWARPGGGQALPPYMPVAKVESALEPSRGGVAHQAGDAAGEAAGDGAHAGCWLAQRRTQAAAAPARQAEPATGEGPAMGLTTPWMMGRSTVLRNKP